MDRWQTEITVAPDAMVTGHMDLYDNELKAVIDWKTVSPTKLKAWKADGPLRALQGPGEPVRPRCRPSQRRGPQGSPGGRAPVGLGYGHADLGRRLPRLNVPRRR